MRRRHLAETLEEQAYCLQHYGCRPVELAEKLGWVGDDVWHAHMVHPSPEEIDRLVASRTGIAHCPSDLAIAITDLFPGQAGRSIVSPE